MRARINLAVFCIVAFFSLFLGSAVSLAAENRVIPGYILVEVSSPQKIDGVLSKHGDSDSTREAVFDSSDKKLSKWFRISVSPGSEKAKVKEYKSDADVEYAEPVFERNLTSIPNDPLLANQWGLNSINAPTAWDITEGDSSVTIAIIDSGIDSDHEDLESKLVPGFSLVSRKKITTKTDDENGHGTHVAGIAAAATNNGKGIAGSGYNAKLMPIKIANQYWKTFRSDVSAQAIMLAAQSGARVINMSYGGSDYSEIEQLAIYYARSKNVVLVAAVGNDGAGTNLPSYPAADYGVMGVSATTQDNGIAPYSNYGSYIDVSAPGGDMTASHLTGGIYSTLPNDQFFRLKITNGVYSNYDYMQGTSMAAPFVSGLAALIISKNPNLNSDQVEDIIKSTAKDLGAPGRDDYYGYGLIDAAAAALKSVSSGTNSISSPEIFLYNGATITRLTDNSYNDYLPQISGNNVVWSGKSGDFDNYEINFFNGTSTTAFYNAGVNDFWPQISGNKFVWMRHYFPMVDIIFYDGTSVIGLDSINRPVSRPQISSDNVVWSNAYDIYLYNGTAITQLSDDYGLTYDTEPQIDGNNVVWMKDNQVAFYNGATTNILSNNGFSPQISGNNVVWTGFDGTDNEIFFYNGMATTQLTNNDYLDTEPQVSGNNVVWTGFDGTDNEIFLYNGLTTTQLTDNGYVDSDVQISGSNVVWVVSP